MKILACIVLVGCSYAQSSRIEGSIAALRTQPWIGADNACVPRCSVFHFTEPMKALLAVGAPAQEPLLKRLFEPAIMDQVMILLGGVGDERSIGPIIEAIKVASAEPRSERRKKLLWAGNIALTNITAADVIWHRGGGIIRDACPTDPVGCWAAWWRRNRGFRVMGIRQSRQYSNYPNYGIYRDLDRPKR